MQVIDGMSDHDAMPIDISLKPKFDKENQREKYFNIERKIWRPLGKICKNALGNTDCPKQND